MWKTNSLPEKIFTVKNSRFIPQIDNQIQLLALTNVKLKVIAGDNNEK